MQIKKTSGSLDKVKIVFFVFLLFFLFGCQKECLPSPDYPLTTEAISSVLAECNMNHTIVENEPISGTSGQGQSFALYENPDDTIAYAGISNATINEEKTLGCTFINLNMNSDITEDECKQAIIFATRLFGGFKNENQVYNKFRKNFNPENGLTWESEINDIYCKIKFNKVNDSLNYTLNVRFATDQDSFAFGTN